MTALAAPVRPDPAFLREVEGRLGKTISPCFHCSKCSSGCPVTFAMDVLPNRAVRMVQMGLRDQLLASSTIWLCASCETCTTRCPNDVDIAALMDVLRQMSQRQGVTPAEPSVPAFHRAFLASVRRWGRVFEAGMLAGYALKSGKGKGVLKDAGLGWQLFKRGKLRLWPTWVRQRLQIRTIFRRARSGDGA
ncbi:MAG: 4Fe-4S dicluster domain-containing protein [Gemmatimonadota bacterium]